MKIKNALRKNLKIQITLILIFLTYFLIDLNHKFVFLFMFSLLLFVNNLIREYYKDIIDIIEYSLLCFLDISYTFLGSFNIEYLIVYIIMLAACVYFDIKKNIDEKEKYLVIEFAIIYTLLKVLLVISMIII
ncbi:hypothetical protein [Oceanivirga salmonicida]|uniref:hypothetical protein n=1 Tax=Oceanivirga salmonicida TaxID=1769291 RepID=UPI000832DBD8|nr:hypothetical protein [Oceanivirga salmonicida]